MEFLTKHPQGFDLTVSIFDQIANQTGSFRNYPELVAYGIENLEHADRVNGDIIVEGEENFQICTNKYTVDGQTIFLDSYQIFSL